MCGSLVADLDPVFVNFTLEIRFKKRIDCDCPMCKFDRSFGASFRDWFLSPDFSHVVIQVGGEEIPAHKIVLASRVPYFKRLFASGMKESVSDRIEIDASEEDSFKQVLEYIYPGQLLTVSFPSLLVFHPSPAEKKKVSFPEI